MPNLNYRGSVADYYVRSTTTADISEDLSENIFDCICLFVPLSEASANLKSDSFDPVSIAAKGYGIIKVVSDNYDDIMLDTGTMLGDWGIAFNDGANVALTVYVVVFDDTGFAAYVGDKSISWAPLTKAYKATEAFSFAKAMFSSDYSGATGHFLDMSLCLGFLCQNDTEFGQFYSCLKIDPLEDLDTIKLQDVDKDTASLPVTAVNGAYVEATGDASDFPYTISGFEFKAVGDKAYWSVESNAWLASPKVNDTNACKILSKTREEETEHCTTLSGTAESDRKAWYWGYLNLIANKSQVMMNNNRYLLGCMFKKHFDNRNASGLYVGNIDCFETLLIDGLKPMGLPSVENTEVNQNLSDYFYQIVLSKRVSVPISISANSANACVIDNNRDLSNYPVPAAAMQRYIDYATKQDIANWWADTPNVMCNQNTYGKIQNMVAINVTKFVPAGFLENYILSFPPFSEAKKGNRIVAEGAWQANYVDKLGMVVVSGKINFNVG